jgi:conjugative relaxase-like TrwC/TraI family protein
MLRIIESPSAAQAKRYYTTADYYTEGQELTGLWRGAGAARLGLDGVIQPADWNALCENQHPTTGERLTPRTRANRRVGYDFNFHVPKSLSVLEAFAEDPRLLEAFREAVRGTMAEMEGEMQARVRKAGRNENRTTGNMVWGSSSIGPLAPSTASPIRICMRTASSFRRRGTRPNRPGRRDNSAT